MGEVVETLLREYKVYIKYVVLFSAAYLVKCVFEFLYNRSAAGQDTRQVLRCKQTMQEVVKNLVFVLFIV